MPSYQVPSGTGIQLTIHSKMSQNLMKKSWIRDLGPRICMKLHKVPGCQHIIRLKTFFLTQIFLFAWPAKAKPGEIPGGFALGPMHLNPGRPDNPPGQQQKCHDLIIVLQSLCIWYSVYIKYLQFLMSSWIWTWIGNWITLWEHLHKKGKRNAFTPDPWHSNPMCPCHHWAMSPILRALPDPSPVPRLSSVWLNRTLGVLKSKNILLTSSNSSPCSQETQEAKRPLIILLLT